MHLAASCCGAMGYVDSLRKNGHWPQKRENTRKWVVFGGFDGFLAGIRVLSKVGTFLAHKTGSRDEKKS